MTKITHLKGSEVLDSRGIPALEIELSTDNGIVVRTIVPNGYARSHQNNVELRDSDDERFLGQGIMRAVGHIANELSEVIVGMDVIDQKALDEALLEADGTSNLNRFGLTTIYGISVAACKAAALNLNVETCEYIAGNKPMVIPNPIASMISGGTYNEKSLEHGFDFKDLSVIPVGAESYRESLMWCSEIYQALGVFLRKQHFYCGTSPTGGYLLNLVKQQNNYFAFEILMAAIELVGLKPDDEVKLFLNSDGDFLYDKKLDCYSFNNVVSSENCLSTKSMMNYYNKLRKTFPIATISNLFHNEDFESLKLFYSKMPDEFEVLADDVFASNFDLIKEHIVDNKFGSKNNLSNGVVISPSLLGTVTNIVEVIEFLQRHEIAVYLSHRIGETSDDFLADLAVGNNCMKMINGAPAHGENLSKYNRLLRLEDVLRGEAVYAGLKAFYGNEEPF
ncbi:hypothetical protein AAEX28_05915 [Lentisphaerota bacterium WC36G]|nr:hypothetical protein LJT99_08775 [Lentisphaerae bacterium WC36]